MARTRWVVGAGLLVGVLAAGVTLGAPADKPQEPAVAVRALKVTKKPSPRFSEKLKVLKALAEVEKQLGEAVAAELKGQVNFAKEDVVFVRWETGGPPFAPLKHEVKGKGKDAVVEFYVDESSLEGRARGKALKVGRDFFAVTKKTAVKFVGRR